MKFDLAINPESDTTGVLATSPSKTAEPQKPIYPEFTTQSEELAEKLSAGQEITATVRLKVTELRSTKGSSKGYMKDGASVTLEIIEMDVDDMEASDPSEESGEKEMDSYFKGKAGYDGPMDGEE